MAAYYAVYLIPKSSYPACYPFISGAQSVPQSLINASVASAIVMTTGQRKINWSGQEWYVKASEVSGVGGRVGPGYNYFADTTGNVWIDTEGNLHLKITYANGHWSCAELMSATTLGYGTYRFTCNTRLDTIDKNVTLGLFTWSDFASVVGNREIDLEFTTWGDTILPNNAQYVVQPYGVSGNMLRYQMTSAAPSVHSFAWDPSKVIYTSALPSGSLINTWTFSRSADVPKSLDERVHLNLWLNGAAPYSGQPVEVVISKFEFTPRRNLGDCNLDGYVDDFDFNEVVLNFGTDYR